MGNQVLLVCEMAAGPSSGVLFTATMVLADAAFKQRQRWADLGGLMQRVSLTIGWTWQTLLAMCILHT
ncbi:hypothetical protein [Streptomyces sp. NEAU-L66]|uniref:hypothetical protein n=1 Tax=Streptomyces sp. NEAU-L66 TaxID=3390812 RepID=UPI0039C5D761